MSLALVLDKLDYNEYLLWVLDGVYLLNKLNYYYEFCWVHLGPRLISSRSAAK